MLVFKEREKPEYPEKNLSKQGREPATNHCAFLANSVNTQLEERSEERQWPIRSNQWCLF